MKRIWAIALVIVLVIGMGGAAWADKAAAADGATFVVKAKMTAGRGALRQLEVKMSDGSELPPDLALSVKNEKIAAFEDAAKGWFRAKKIGSTYLYAKSESTGLSAKCKLTVKSNTFSRKKPLYKKGAAGVYTSAKKLYMKGDYLYAHIFVYNYTKYTLRFSDGIHVYATLYDCSDGEKMETCNEIWAPRGLKIGSKKYVVFKCKFPLDAYGSVDLRDWDLRAHELDAYLDIPSNYDPDEDDEPDVYFTKNLLRMSRMKGLTEAPDAAEQR